MHKVLNIVNYVIGQHQYEKLTNYNNYRTDDLRWYESSVAATHKRTNALYPDDVTKEEHSSII